jgi:hypothetical protein
VSVAELGCIDVRYLKKTNCKSLDTDPLNNCQDEVNFLRKIYFLQSQRKINASPQPIFNVANNTHHRGLSFCNSDSVEYERKI